MVWICFSDLAFIQPHTQPSKYRGSALPLPLTHIHRDNTESLLFRIFEHSEVLLKNEYRVLNFYSNLAAYGHNLLVYERDVRGANLHPGVNLLPCANLHMSANCAHEHGFN